MTLANKAGEEDLVLYCRSDWFLECVFVCVRVRWGEDEAVCMIWKRWSGVLTMGKLGLSGIGPKLKLNPSESVFIFTL